MWKAILQSVKATFPVIAVIFSTCIHQSVLAQQHIIANKDNTRPETNRQFNSPARMSALVATKYNGYNEIQWSAIGEQSNRKFIVEYSYDGINFQSAGQVLSANGLYNMKHHTLDTRSVLYRIRIEEFAGRLYYSDGVLLGGDEMAPVKIYPTTVTGSVLNANAGFPVERVIIVSLEGMQMFAKDLNGVRDFIPITIPSLNRGTYLITFYGNGWKSTSKFIIG